MLTSQISGNVVHAQKCIEEKKASEMLLKFYTSIARIFSYPNTYYLDTIVNIYYTENLRKEINNPELDLGYDPLIKAQDFNFDCVKTLTIKKDLKRDDLYYVSYINPYDNIKETIKLLVVNDGGHYKIDYVYLDELNSYIQYKSKLFKDSIKK